MDWQPIEKAPRVEFDDLIGFDIDNGVYAMQLFEEKWVDSNQSIAYPTHWMPLPEPPK